MVAVTASNNRFSGGGNCVALPAGGASLGPDVARRNVTIRHRPGSAMATSPLSIRTPRDCRISLAEKRIPAWQGAIVFVGDSLIAGWITLKNDFAPLHVANVGIGGDVSRGVLFRLQEDVIDLKPRAVVILIGTNDMSAKEDLSLLMANLTSILKTLRDYNPSLPIVLCKLPPRNYSASPVSTRDMLALNSRLDNLSGSDAKLAVMDLYRLLALPDGSIDPQNFEADKLHISPTGYKKFHDALIPILLTLGVE
jgi:lysophospholipase L1-like esterase